MTTLLSAEEVRRHVLFKRDVERTLDDEVADKMLEMLSAGAAPNYLALQASARRSLMGAHLFHTSPVHLRPRIEADGLLALPPVDGNFSTVVGASWMLGGQPEAVYAQPSIDRVGRWAHWSAYSWDVWAISVYHLTAHPSHIPT